MEISFVVDINMQKQFLVTISNDTESLSGVTFLCSFFKKMSQHQVTLFHICRLDSHEMSKALTEMWMDPEDKIQRYMTIGARNGVNKARELLAQGDMSINQIITKTVEERYGKVKDILREGAKSLVDAIILGKRASYTLQWVFERPADETVQAVIKDSCFTSPVWICPEPDLKRKNVLLCVDGSKNSLRAVDHVGFILSKQDQHTITLLHVSAVNDSNSEPVFNEAVQILNCYDIKNERIRTITRWGFSVYGTILSEIQNNGYAVVALGLRGHHKQGLLKEYNLAGGTTSKIINKLEKTSLWCCP